MASTVAVRLPSTWCATLPRPRSASHAAACIRTAMGARIDRKVDRLEAALGRPARELDDHWRRRG